MVGGTIVPSGSVILNLIHISLDTSSKLDVDFDSLDFYDHFF